MAANGVRSDLFIPVFLEKKEDKRQKMALYNSAIFYLFKIMIK